MYNNIFYFIDINVIGGIETFFYNLAKKYNAYDITIFYRTGDLEQVKRLKKYVRVKQYHGEKIECKKAFFNATLDIIDNVKAEKYYQIVHGDYKALKIYPNTHSKIDTYLGVTQLVCDTFKEVTGIDAELVYNVFVPEKPKKCLNLISATRLTREKGKHRMEQFANMLDAAGIPYLWTIFTDNKFAIANKNIAYMTPRLNILDYIANADYLVQLSDNEGYCYSVVEALSVGTPVIVTDCPVFREIGINETNGFILDFGMNNVPIDKIYKGLPDFTYEPIQDKWTDYLVPGPSTYQEELRTMVHVQVLKPYYDLQINRFVKKNEDLLVSQVRAEELQGAGLVDIFKEAET